MLTVSYVKGKGAITGAQTATVLVSQPGEGSTDFHKAQNMEKLRKNIVRLEGSSLLWKKQKRDAANAARKFYLLTKYGSDDGWNAKLSREISIPVKVAKYEDGKSTDIENAEIRIDDERGTKKESMTTDENGSAVFKTKVADGKVSFVFSVENNIIGYERQRSQIGEVQPGQTKAQEVQFIFSKSARTIVVRCRDQFGDALPEAPVSIVENPAGAQEYEPEMTNEQGIARFSVDAQENTVFLIYCKDSDTNCEAEKPYEITIESGKSEYLVKPELRRKIRIHVIASTTTADGSSNMPKTGVLVSVGKTKLGATGNNGEWQGVGDTIPDQDNVAAEPIPSSFRVDKIASGYSVVLKYVPEAQIVTTPEPEPEDTPAPPPALKFALDSQSKVSEIEVWIYVTDGKADGLKFIDEMSFESAGKEFRLVQLDSKLSGEELLEIPAEAEGNALLLYHPDYWRQNLQWQKIQEPIKMVGLKEERSFRDFNQKEIDGAEYFFKRAEKLYDENDYAEAIKDYQNAIRLVPRSKYYLKSGWANFSADQLEEAEKQCDRGLELKLLDEPASEQDIRWDLQNLREQL